MPNALTLVTVAGLQDYLGLASGTDDEILTTLALGAEALFAAGCGRSACPFQDAESGRIEVQDATGTHELWLDYGIAALTSIVVRRCGHADETLDGTDTNVLRFVTGRARVTRVDGGRFGRAGEADAIVATYDASADLPDDAVLAVTRAVARVYRQLGAEDVKSERVGSYSADLATTIDGDEVWVAAIAAHRRVFA